MSSTKDGESVRKAKSRRDLWDPRSSKCPIRGRPFRGDEAYPHSLDAQVRSAYAAHLVRKLTHEIVALRMRSARY